MEQNVCCFTGHKQLPTKEIKTIIKRLNDEIDHLIHQGVTNFMAGGALGFDTIAASLIIAKREMGYPVKLILVLPCDQQNGLWTPEQTKLYEQIIKEADGLYYISDEHKANSLTTRNRFMVNKSDFCICYSTQNEGETFQMVIYAKEKGINLIKVSL